MTDEAQITLAPGQVDLFLWQKVYRDGVSPVLQAEAKNQVTNSANIVAKAASGDIAIYGVNTGFGKLAQTRISQDDLTALQRNLILSHCCGFGEITPKSITRLMMGLKLNSLGRGSSGVRWELISLLQDMLRLGVTPCVPAQGSVGASGDLAPLAHMAAVMIGEGEANFNGSRLPAKTALKQAGLSPIILQAKEGLALINGTQFSAAYALAAFFETWHLSSAALITGAMSTDAAMGSSAPFRPEIHALRGHRGQIDAASALRDLMAGSVLRESHRDDDDRVQDPYCLRCQPQVMGACLDTLRDAARVLEIEANAVTDNPLVLPGGDIVSGGNFHAEPIGFVADKIALAIAEIGAIAQRRIAMLVDPAMNFGLPAFLSPNPGVNSGFMIAEVTSAALMSENKHLAAPCVVDSTPTSANQEDHVSMAAHGARRLVRMNDNLRAIIGIEWLIASQGIELRQISTSETLSAAIKALRAEIPALEDDRYMADDLSRAAVMLGDGVLVKASADINLPHWT